MEKHDYRLAHNWSNFIVDGPKIYDERSDEFVVQSIDVEVDPENKRRWCVSEADFEKYRKACQIAKKAHEGQKDKGGEDYIMHPIRVASTVRLHLAPKGSEIDTMCVAMLHDVVEDSETTLDDLKKEFPDQIVEAVNVLARRDNETYDEYIQKVVNSGNLIACIVKAADLRDNMRLSRIEHPSQKDIKRAEKYTRVYDSFFRNY